MNFRIIIPILLMLLFFPINAKAGETKWVLFGQEEMFDHYYDEANFLRTPDNIIGIWIKVIPKTQVAKEVLLEIRRRRAFIMEGYEDYEFTVSAMEINCTEKTRAMMESWDYGKLGKVLDKVGATVRNWKPIAPTDHPHAFYLKTLCKKHLE